MHRKFFNKESVLWNISDSQWDPEVIKVIEKFSSSVVKDCTETIKECRCTLCNYPQTLRCYQSDMKNDALEVLKIINEE